MNAQHEKLIENLDFLSDNTIRAVRLESYKPIYTVRYKKEALLELLTKLKKLKRLVLSQEDLPQTLRRPTQKENAREVGLSQRSVNRIVKKDLRLTCMKDFWLQN